MKLILVPVLDIDVFSLDTQLKCILLPLEVFCPFTIGHSNLQVFGVFLNTFFQLNILCFYFLTLFLLCTTNSIIF